MIRLFLFAETAPSGDGTTGWWVTALIVSVTSNLILLWREYRRARNDGVDTDKRQRRDTVEEYEALLRKGDKATARHETQILALQRVAAILSERCAECDADMERVFGFLRLLHGVAERLADDIHALGGKAEEVPAMPRMPKKRYPETEFMERTIAQFNKAGRAADAGDSINAGATQPPPLVPPSAPPTKETAGEDTDGG